MHGPSTLRYPSPAFPTRFRMWALICLFAGVALLLVSPLAAQSDVPQVRVVEITDTITPPMAQYVERGIAAAENAGDDAIVLEIDTPGGLSSAMDDINRAILESEVPVIAYVTPRGARAASAGVFITYAAHVAAMAPGTSIGSASPVAGDGSEMTDTMEAKVTNDAVSNIRNLAEYRDRNADWAEQAVREAVNITSAEALDLGVINLIAPNLATLLNDVDGMQVTMPDGSSWTLATAGAETRTTSMNFIESILQMISNPTIAYLLMSFGALGIFLELGNPGTFVPGTIGVICIVLGLYSLGTLPVNWTGAALIAIAFGLFFLDLFVSSFGLLLIAGLAFFIVGSYMLIDTSVPGYGRVAPVIIWTSAGLIVVSAAIIGSAVLRVLRKRPATGKSAMIGEVGVARQPLSPTGLVFMQGELWTATVAGHTDTDPPIPAGSHVEVVDVQGLLLIVRPADAPQTEPVARRRGDSVLPVTMGVRDAREESRPSTVT